MSTNFYTLNTPNSEEGIHLGKYAQGSPFMFRGYPEQGVVDYASWTRLAQSGQIVDECGRELTFEELEDIVRHTRQWGMPHRSPYPYQVDDENGNRFTIVNFC